MGRRNVIRCENCGLYRPDRVETRENSYAICDLRFAIHLRQPLYIVGGASGSGKSVVCAA
jgi:ABC-type dipeptide/oligopeptide/nickel transport system ATPase component